MKKWEVIQQACNHIATGATDSAAEIVRNHYPFEPAPIAARAFGKLESMRVFKRDGFVDRYSGERLLFPGVLRILSLNLPSVFPFHRNWKTDECHFAYYELIPTIDHEVPVTRGGLDAPSNWVTTSMMRNMAKSNFLLSEIGWSKHPEGLYENWDGMTGWFLSEAETNPGYLADSYLRQWNVAAKAVISESASA